MRRPNTPRPSIAYPRQLPLAPPPIHDELPISWLRRIAEANDVTFAEFLRHLGIAINLLWKLDVAPTPEQAARIAGATGRRPEEIVAMTIGALDDPSARYMARKHDFQHCVPCSRSFGGRRAPMRFPFLPFPLLPITLRHWRASWSVNCEVCGAPLTDATTILSQKRSRLADKHNHGALANKGAAILKAAIDGNDWRRLSRIRNALIFSVWLSDTGDDRTVLMSSTDNQRLDGLCAIARAEKQPLRKVAWLLVTAKRDRFDRIAGALRRSDHAKHWVFSIATSMRDQARALVRARDRASTTAAKTTQARLTRRGRPRFESEYLRAAKIAIARAGAPDRTSKRARLLRQADLALAEIRRPNRTPICETRKRASLTNRGTKSPNQA